MDSRSSYSSSTTEFGDVERMIFAGGDSEDATVSMQNAQEVAFKPLNQPSFPPGNAIDMDSRWSYTPSMIELGDFERMIFSGGDSEDVTVFIRNVQEAAFAQGRQRDDEWRVDCVGTRLTGAAMRWYLLLDDEIRLSWAKLCQALLQRFPPVPIAPTPLTMRSLMDIASRFWTFKTGTLKGRVRICSSYSGTFLGYLPRYMNNLSTESELSKDISEALVVEVPAQSLPGQRRWSMRMVNPAPYDSECMYLGLKNIGTGNFRKYRLAQCLPDPTFESSAPAMASVWGIDPADGKTREVYLSQTADDRTLTPLTPGLQGYDEKRLLTLLPHLHSGTHVKLIFEKV
ncbi:hypothetical protein FRB94_011049 [Tulasnella sp. JGI-2019a]|nr:hypothetical protein FRB93_009654 [Tulasnella sp. JGI-2019a]KAG8993120.1 hypothetical protein FRB94_011049 [Tulasnella sp. JGI-2019a]KAG9023262.1 hypothetical protein FRB95_013335 [Tulasnella sp. JGI-2019a]